MKSLIAKRHLVRQNLIAIIGLCVSFYFGYHLMGSERSYWRLSELNAEIQKEQSMLDALQGKKSDIEQKVVMMRPGSINRDLLDERVRSVLGYRSKDEAIILHN